MTIKTNDVSPREYAVNRYGHLASQMVDNLTQFICDVLNSLENEYNQVINVPDNFCDLCVVHYNAEHTSIQTGRLIMDGVKTAQVIHECDSELVAQLTFNAFDTMLACVKAITLGQIRACDPCSVKALMNECREQVYDHSYKVDFDKCNLYLRTLLLSEAVKELCIEGLISPEVNHTDDGLFDVTFRQP